MGIQNANDGCGDHRSCMDVEGVAVIQSTKKMFNDGDTLRNLRNY